MKTYSVQDKLYKIIIYLLVTIFAVACLYPFIYVLMMSVTPYQEYLSNPMRLFPTRLDFSAYKTLLGFPLIYSGYRVTIFITLVGTAINIVLMCLTAYPLSKKDLKGRGFILGLIVFTMFFNGGMIPNFYLIRTLKLYNTIWALIIPGVLSAYNLILMKNFISQIPDSLEESAVIDGANEFVILWKIIVPLSKPAIATFIIFYAVGQWNTLFSAILYTSKRELWPLMLILREMVVEDSMMMAFSGNSAAMDQEMTTIFTMKMAVIIITVLPILCIYPFMQKHFTKGIMMGSVKG